MTFEHPIEAFRNLLPKWGWNHTDFAFDWIPSFPDQVVLKSYASTSPNNWKIAVSFLKNLTWDSCSTHKTAYIEIAFEAWYSGVRFEGINATPKKYPCMIRKCINQCVKLQHHGKIVPGNQKPGWKSLGEKRYPLDSLIVVGLRLLMLPSNNLPSVSFLAKPRGLVTGVILLFDGLLPQLIRCLKFHTLC